MSNLCKRMSKSNKKAEKEQFVRFKEGTFAFIDYLIANGAKTINLTAKDGRFSISTPDIAITEEQMKSVDFQEAMKKFIMGCAA